MGEAAPVTLHRLLQPTGAYAPVTQLLHPTPRPRPHAGDYRSGKGGWREGRFHIPEHTPAAAGTKPAAARRRRPSRRVCIPQCCPCSCRQWTIRLLSAEALLQQPAMLQAEVVGGWQRGPEILQMLLCGDGSGLLL